MFEELRDKIEAAGALAAIFRETSGIADTLDQALNELDDLEALVQDGEAHRQEESRRSNQ